MRDINLTTNDKEIGEKGGSRTLRKEYKGVIMCQIKTESGM